MPGNARLNDTWVGVCLCHPPIPVIGMSGPIVTASNNVIINNQGAARLNDTVIGFCGHSGLIVSASGDVVANNQGVARIGDSVAGCVVGTISTGSGNVKSNG